jgi:hypothetical protein
LSDLVAPNDRARAGRHGALRNLVAAATEAAEAGDREDALEAVNALARRIGADKNPWVTEEAAARLEPILDELTSCLESHPPTPNGDNHDGEDMRMTVVDQTNQANPMGHRSIQVKIASSSQLIKQAKVQRISLHLFMITGRAVCSSA